SAGTCRPSRREEPPPSIRPVTEQRSLPPSSSTCSSIGLSCDTFFPCGEAVALPRSVEARSGPSRASRPVACPLRVGSTAPRYQAPYHFGSGLSASLAWRTSRSFWHFTWVDLSRRSWPPNHPKAGSRCLGWEGHAMHPHGRLPPER